MFEWLRFWEAKDKQAEQERAIAQLEACSKRERDRVSESVTKLLDRLDEQEPRAHQRH